MCVSAPKAPTPPAPPPPAPPPPEVKPLQPAQQPNSDARRNRSGRSSLRIDRTSSVSGSGSGLNIPV